MKKLTTKDLELATLRYEKQADIRSLRTSMPWECDVLAISANGYATEYELKISRADFKSDFKKPKHKKFVKGNGGMIKRFWFVVPYKMVAPYEIPEYAGLLYCKKKGDKVWLEPAKYPEALEAKKVDAKTIRRLYRSMMFRFLQLNFKETFGNVAL